MLLTFSMHMFFMTIFKVFSKDSFMNTISVSNSLDLEKVGPDLGSNCLQWLSADDTSR